MTHDFMTFYGGLETLQTPRISCSHPILPTPPPPSALWRLEAFWTCFGEKKKGKP